MFDFVIFISTVNAFFKTYENVFYILNREEEADLGTISSFSDRTTRVGMPCS